MRCCVKTPNHDGVIKTRAVNERKISISSLEKMLRRKAKAIDIWMEKLLETWNSLSHALASRMWIPWYHHPITEAKELTGSHSRVSVFRYLCRHSLSGLPVNIMKGEKFRTCSLVR